MSIRLSFIALALAIQFNCGAISAQPGADETIPDMKVMASEFVYTKSLGSDPVTTSGTMTIRSGSNSYGEAGFEIPSPFRGKTCTLMFLFRVQSGTGKVGLADRDNSTISASESRAAGFSGLSSVTAMVPTSGSPVAVLRIDPDSVARIEFGQISITR